MISGRKDELISMYGKLDKEEEREDEFFQWFERFAGPGVAESNLKKAVTLFSKYKSGIKKGGDADELQASLNQAIAFFSKAIVSSRLAAEPDVEARACANLATCYHTISLTKKSVLFYLESCAAFRIAEASKPNNANANNVGTVEKRILNYLTLRLNDVKEFATSRVFCLVQLKFAADKSNLEVLKDRLAGIDTKLRANRENGGGIAGEESEDDDDDDVTVSTLDSSVKKGKRDDLNDGGGDDDDMPPGTP